MTNFYEDIAMENFSGSISSEIAILQEEIIFPHKWENKIGKFFIPILFPLVTERSGAVERTKPAPNIKNIVCQGFTVNSYLERNFIRLMIPKHLYPTVAVWDFAKKIWYIPQYTVFIVSFIGGSTLASDIKVTGVSL